MIDTVPQKFAASPGDLLSLGSALTGYKPCRSAGHISGVWLWRGDGPALHVSAVDRKIASMFEVFTLAIDVPVQWALRESRHDAATRATAWPFSQWQVDIVWQHDWIIAADRMPDDWHNSAESERFGNVPAGVTNACMVASALLFTGAGATCEHSRLLINQATMPYAVDVITHQGLIDQAMGGALAMPLDQYLAGNMPGHPS
jgi:hypothetical protein